jgi:hypothetical protein
MNTRLALRASLAFVLLLAVTAGGGEAAERRGLPAPAPGVTDLRFGEWFQLPVGRGGLEPSERLRALDGKRVRVLGYVVGEEQPTPGLFMLTARPVTLSEVADGPADDLPPATLFVHLVPIDADKVIAHQPGLLVVSGVLEIGNRDERNGRTSFARLRLDQPLPRAEPAGVPAQASAHAH